MLVVQVPRHVSTGDTNAAATAAASDPSDVAGTLRAGPLHSWVWHPRRLELRLRL